ncbi:MAG: ScyD/ScyE family protein, partial [Chloroflexi bacterium CFX6]|nr:ScyD/ScyE family protein [Chloroflexi bacterium CFX6]
ATLSAEVDEDLTVNLKNVGAAPHDIVFELDGGRVERTAVIRGGENASVTFQTPLTPGEYVYYCSVGNHRARGMEGKLTVTASSGLEVKVEASEFKFVPAAIAAAADKDLLKNVGAAPHDIVFELDGGRIERTPVIRGGEDASLTFRTPPIPGEYVYYCSVGNHRARGMEGKLTIGGAVPAGPITGLLNPHGLFVAADGTLLVSEGGTGTAAPPNFAPGNGDGRVQRIALADPAQRTTIVGNLTNSLDPGGGVVGANHAIEWPAGAATGTAKVVLVAQAGGPGHLRPAEAAKILRVDAGGATVLADPLAFEQANNPGGEQGAEGIDSNPWRLVAGPGGMVYIADAGANDMLKLDPATGTLGTYAVFAEINGSQAIPTGIAFDTDGVAYVSLLGSLFSPAAEAQIRRLEDKNADGDALDPDENTLFIDGLKTPTDIALGPTGRLYVSEIFPATLSAIDPACWTAAAPCAPGAKAVVATDLHGISAIAFDANGDALVAVNDAPGAMGPSLNSNQVRRLPAASLVPAPTATATTEPTPTAATPTVPTATPTTTNPTPTPRPGIYLPLLLKSPPTWP